MPPEIHCPSEVPALSSAPDIHAVVTEIRELSRTNGKPIFQLALNVAAFPPQSSLQGHLPGTLTAVSRSGIVLVVPVLAVQQDAGGELWHTTEKPLQPGTSVRITVFGTEEPPI